MGWYGGSGGGGALSDPPYTIEGNPTGATANTTAFTIGSLTAKTAPASTDQLMLQDNAASGALKSVPWSSMPGAGGGMSIGGVVTGGTASDILFVDTGGVLAQDANLTWNKTTATLQLSAQPAIFVVPNASGNNWFVGGAGNATLTAFKNFGMGASALSSLTSNGDNVAIGFQAAKALTAANCIAIGSNALLSQTSSGNCIAIGTAALNQLGGSGGSTVAIGAFALNATTTGDQNTVIGDNAGRNATGNNNVIIGAGTTASISGSVNTLIGYHCGNSLTGASSNNTIIGAWSGPSAAMSNVIALSDGNGSLLLDYNYTNASIWTSSKAIMVTPVTVASLPAAAVAGRRHFVTDATATTFGSIVAGTGTNKVPVYDDGTSWRIG